MKDKLALRLLPVANAYAAQAPNREFKRLIYACKSALLSRAAVKDGYDLQVIPAKICFRCDGTGLQDLPYFDEEERKCPWCLGTGNYIEEKRIYLQRFSVNGRTYHCPTDKPEGERKEIVNGYILHKIHHKYELALSHLFVALCNGTTIRYLLCAVKKYIDYKKRCLKAKLNIWLDHKIGRNNDGIPF